MDFILSFERWCLSAPLHLGRRLLLVSLYLCCVMWVLPWLPSSVGGWVVADVGRCLCLHLFVPCAVVLACQETVVVPFGVAAVVALAARLVLSSLHLDFVPKQGGLASWELVVPVVQ